MSHRLVLLALVAGCQTRLAAPEADAPDDRLVGESLRAEGRGTEGSWQAYERADYTCTTSGGSYGVDCSVTFAVEPSDDGGLWVTIEHYSPSNDWKRQDLVELLTGRPFLVAEGAPAVGSTKTSWGMGWDYELTLEGDELRFELSGIDDDLSRCSGERITETCDATFSDPELGTLALPAPVPLADAAADLVISELVADPSACSDSHAEWLEVQNLGSLRVDLAGLAFEDAGGAPAVVDDTVVVEAFGRVVLGRGAAADFCDPAVAIDAGLSGSMSLNNGGDTVRMLVDGAVIDEVTYGSVGRDVAVARDSTGAWCEGPPTPGTASAECPTPDPVDPLKASELLPGELVVTEVMFDPSAMSDTTGEWFEVHNTTAWPVDLAGLGIEDEVGNQGTVTSAIVQAGGYAVLGRTDADGWATGPFTPDAFYGTNPALNNSGDQVVLISDAGVVDATPVLVPVAGVALQRDADVWCDAATPIGTSSDRGTPGEPNPGC